MRLRVLCEQQKMGVEQCFCIATGCKGICRLQQAEMIMGCHGQQAMGCFVLAGALTFSTNLSASEWQKATDRRYRSP